MVGYKQHIKRALSQSESSSSSSDSADESLAAGAAGAAKGGESDLAPSQVATGKAAEAAQRPFVLVVWRQSQGGGLRIVSHLDCEHNAGG